MDWNNKPSFTNVQLAITEYCQSNEDVSSWSLGAKLTKGRQSLLLGEGSNNLSVYQDRNIEDFSIEVTLFSTSVDKKQIGKSSSTIDTEESIPEQLQQILENAKLAMNPWYPMPTPPSTPYPSVETADASIINRLDESHQSLLNRINIHAKTMTDVQVNSAELFCNTHHQVLASSEGIFAQKNTTDIYFEVAMEMSPGPNTQESLKYWHFIGIEDADIERLLDEVAEETLLTENIQLPETQSNATVLIDSYGISKLMAAIVSQIDGSAEYSKGPHLKADDVLPSIKSDGASDKLTLRIDPLLTQMAKSSPFTDEGLIAESATLVSENTVQVQTLNTRMAHYLDKTTNNIFGNIAVNTGQKTKVELLNSHDNILEVLDFSSLLVNPSSLTWSSEIKLGRLYKNGEPIATIKGGIISGNLRENLAGFMFSNEESKRNSTGGYFEAASGYSGPQHMLIWHGINIAGTGQENNHE